MPGLYTESETKLVKKPVMVFKDKCRLCSGRMLCTDKIFMPKRAHIKCEDCGHTATVIEAITAVAKMRPVTK